MLGLCILTILLNIIFFAIAGFFKHRKHQNEQKNGNSRREINTGCGDISRGHHIGRARIGKRNIRRAVYGIADHRTDDHRHENAEDHSDSLQLTCGGGGRVISYYCACESRDKDIARDHHTACDAEADKLEGMRAELEEIHSYESYGHRDSGKVEELDLIHLIREACEVEIHACANEDRRAEDYTILDNREFKVSSHIDDHVRHKYLTSDAVYHNYDKGEVERGIGSDRGGLEAVYHIAVAIYH